MDDIRETRQDAKDRLLRLLGGPALTLGLACGIALVQALGHVSLPSITSMFLAVLVLTSLTGKATPTLINLLLTIVATQFLYYQSGRLGWSGPGLLRTLIPLVLFPVTSGLVLLMCRRLSAALAAPVQAERELFRAVMASMHDAIVETDWQGIRDVNDSFCRMTGFSREELIGAKAPFPFWPIEQYATIAAALETSMRGKALDFELVLTRKNGERFPVLLSVSRVVDGGAKTSRVLYSFRDITELKRAQQEQKRAQEKLQQAVDAVTIGTWEWDFASNRVVWGGHHEELWGMKPGEFGGTFEEIEDRVHPEDRARVAADAMRARDKGGLHDVEFRIIRPDGSIHWIASRGSTVQDEKGSRTRMSGIVLDVTERRRAQEMLAGQSDILEKIARGVSLDETMRALVETIERLLPESRCSVLTLTSDRGHLHVAAAPRLPSAYNAVVEGLEIGMGRGSCGEAAFTGRRVISVDTQVDARWQPWKGIAAKFELRACTSEPILSHDGRVLGTFALYHQEPTNPGPEELRVLELAARLAAIAIERDQEERELRDAKENAEIANRTKDRFLNLLSHELRTPLTPILTLASLLERDARLPEDMRADLEMMRRNAEMEAQLIDDLLELVRMAQGPAPEIFENLGRGRGEPARTGPLQVEEGEASGEGKRLRILLVEDHVDTAKTLAKILERRGHAVTLAGTVADAVAAGIAGTHDVLLSDIGLPDGSGLEVVKRVRAVRAIPAIALSGFGAPEDIRRSQEAGFEMHLTKPVDFQTLLAALGRVTS